MSTNYITVIGIIGETAKSINLQFEKFRERRLVDNEIEENLVGFEIDKVIGKIKDNVGRLPIYYYRKYIDSWSVAGSCFHVSGIKTARLLGNDYVKLFHCAEISQEDLQICQNIILNDRAGVEDIWFAQAVVDCWKNMEWLNCPKVILAYEDCLGESWTNEMIEKSLNINFLNN